eukprot:gene4702-6602_t
MCLKFYFILCSFLIDFIKPDFIYNPSLYPDNSLSEAGSAYPFGSNIPISRIYHSVVQINSFLVVYGGYSSTGSFLGDINLYDINLQTWSGPISKKQCCNAAGETIETIASDPENIVSFLPYVDVGFQGSPPLPRAEHGASGLNNINRVSGSLPPKRYGHSMISDAESHKIYVFGGYGSGVDGVNNNGLSDLWRYDIHKNKWEMLSANSIGPSNRHYSSIAMYQSDVIIFGGKNPVSNITYNDVWVYRVAINQWQQLFHKNNYNIDDKNYGFVPPPLYNAHLIPMVNSSMEGFFVYGGMGGGSSSDLQLLIGQLYLFVINKKLWHTIVNENGNNNNEYERSYIHDIDWNYVRMTKASPNLGDTGRGADRSRGKLYKQYVLEEVVYDQKSKKLYELGGVQTINSLISSDYQQVNANPEEISSFSSQGPISLGPSASVLTFNPFEVDSSGGVISEPLWDLRSGEKLRDRVEITINQEWSLNDLFANNNNNNNNFKMMRSLRVFTVAEKDMVLLETNSAN